jgi:hypothetical protein
LPSCRKDSHEKETDHAPRIFHAGRRSAEKDPGETPQRDRRERGKGSLGEERRQVVTIKKSLAIFAIASKRRLLRLEVGPVAEATQAAKDLELETSESEKQWFYRNCREEGIAVFPNGPVYDFPK